MKKYISIILASVFLFACSPPDPGITSDIQVLNPGETYNTHVGKINSNFANLNTDKLEDAPSDGSQYARQDGTWSVITAGGGAVDSVFGRTGAVVAESGDYASFYLALTSCTTSGQIPKWNGSAWTCATDETGSGSLPPGNATNDILQWDGTDWLAQGYINGLIDDTAGDGDTTAVLSANEINTRIAAVNEVPAGGTTGQVLGKASDTDNDVAWLDQTGSGGGVTSIIAGTNITIDPTSGLGDVTINAATDSVGGYVPVPTNSDSACTEGQYAIDRPNNFIYWCYAPDSWDRVPSTFDQWDNPSTVYYTLTVNPVPVNGRVIEPSNGTNINCGTGGNSCEADYVTGTDAVFTAVPESGYTLDTWSGTNLTDNGDGTATVHIDQDISDVTATFIASGGGSYDLLQEDFEGGSGVTWIDHTDGGTINHAAAHSGTWSCPAIGSQALDIARDATSNVLYTETDVGTFTTGHLSVLVNVTSTGDMAAFDAVNIITIGDNNNTSTYFDLYIKLRLGSNPFFRVDYVTDGNTNTTLGDSSDITLGEDYEITCDWEHVDAGDDTLTCSVDGNVLGTMPVGTSFHEATDRYILAGVLKAEALAQNVQYQVDNLYIDSTNQPDSCN